MNDIRVLSTVFGEYNASMIILTVRMHACAVKNQRKRIFTVRARTVTPVRYCFGPSRNILRGSTVNDAYRVYSSPCTDLSAVSFAF